ncbi:MAG: hypothetical protein WBI14_00540 [Anaerolineaceae bacterium]
METIGGGFGEFGLAMIIFLVARPVLQAILNRMRTNGKTVPEWLKKVSQFVTRYHRYFGMVAVVAILLHFILQFTQLGLSPVPGLIAGGVLMVQAVLGFVLRGQKDPEQRKKLALAHRSLGIVLVVAILFHRIL